VLRRVRDFLFGTSGPPPEPIVDPRLGVLTLDADGEWWEGRAQFGSTTVRVQISGDVPPAPALLTTARQILDQATEWERRVEQMKVAYVREWPQYGLEVRALRLDSVLMPWPDRVSDGMLYFDSDNGPGRVWRCDFSADGPHGLGFDD
jgi:hypothetical protein